MSAKTMRVAQTGTLWRVASTHMPTKWGMFDAIGFERDISNGTRRVETALALVMGDPQGVPLLRIHSQCFTGEVLGSLRCDCHDQLEMAMQAIAEEGRGLVIYEYQEGRGIGLMAKLEAYELQDAGLDTVEANHALGYKADCRDFDLPAAVVRDLGIKQVRLLSNNPRKARALAKSGVEVVVQLSCEATPNPHSLPYLRTKKERMGHTLSLRQPESTDQTRDLRAVPSRLTASDNRLMKRPFREQIRAAMKAENEEFSAQVRSADAKEAFTAFLEKRLPHFTETDMDRFRWNISGSPAATGEQHD
jgi:GTP cyclohydrolase II